MRKANAPQEMKASPKTLPPSKFGNLMNLGNTLWKNARPYLALKYWPVYLIAFGIGLYLWGPLHGWQKLKNLQNRQSQQSSQLSANETLQRQLDRLRHELQTVQNEKQKPEFLPVNFSRPALGKIIRSFDWVKSGGSWSLHAGVDIGMPPGNNILASAAGTVSGIKEMDNGEYMVTIDHGSGWQSIYANLATVQVSEAQSIIKGVIIGTSSAGGCDPSTPCFHFALYHNQQPVDPEKVITFN